MAKEKILVVEDEEDILALVRYNLARDGYQVSGVTTGEDALKSVKKSLPDLIILDLMLPGVDGLEVCRQIKHDPDTASVAIIMLTAKGEEPDIVSGLELGADDYMVKPFSSRVLSARIGAVLRRKVSEPKDPDTPVRIHNLVIHPGRHELLVDDKRIDLTLTEFRILHYLGSHPGWVFTRYQIVEAVHGDNYPVTERSVDVQVVGLRKKLGDVGNLIETVRGIGYRFKEQV